MKLLFKGYLYESASQDLIIKPGTILYHGTIEDFLEDNIDVGGYDDILWTSQSEYISKTYIPYSGTSGIISLSPFLKPQEHREKLDKTFGVDFGEAEYDKNGRAISYYDSNVMQKIKKPYEKEIEDLIEKSIKLANEQQELTKLKREYSENWKKIEKEGRQYEDEHEEMLTKWGEIEDRLKRVQDELTETYHRRNDLGREIKIKFFDYIKGILKQLGYSPTTKYGVPSDPDDSYFYVNYNDDMTIKENKPSEGRLFTFIVKEPLKIYDITLGETVEPDLMEKDYHKLDLFREAESKGYDGIKISDFAQHKTRGNVGHYSIGIFKDSIKKLKKEKVSVATHPED